MYVQLQPLSDAYGLRINRNGQWEWTLAPGVSPSSRYQHAAVSVGGTFPTFFATPLFLVFALFLGLMFSVEALEV